MTYFQIFILAFLVEFFLVLIARKIYPLLKLMDKPLKYNLTRSAIPYSGGILIYLIFIIFTVFLLPINLKLGGILLASTILVFISFIDDFFSLSPKLRLFVQLFSASLVFFSGTAFSYLNLPFGAAFNFEQILVWGFPLASFLLTVAWILAVTNMINWIDGINGLSSGISLITILALLFLALRPGFHVIDQTFVLVLASVIGGAVLAFWLFEFYPAKFLMGDSGTMFLGFIIAVLAIVSGGKLATAFIVLALPIIDGFWVILRRIYEKKSPFKGDLWHFHHRLLYLGLSERQVLAVYYCFTAIFALVALTLESFWKIVAILFLFLLISAAEILFYYKQNKLAKK